MASLSKEESKAIAKETALEVLNMLGIDASNHIEMQQDMAFLRKYRNRADSIGNRLFMWLFIIMVTGGSLASWKEAIAGVFRGQ